MRGHKDLGVVVAHGSPILPGKVVDVVTLLVGQAGRRLKLKSCKMMMTGFNHDTKEENTMEVR